VTSREDVVGLDSAILHHPRVWEASGHVASFTDPLIECKVCHARFRADHADDIKKHGVEHKDKADWTEVKHFNLMFKTFVGPIDDEQNKTYLRPETAQGIFINYANVLETMRVKIPFGIAQIGRSFRNEIAPRDFIFRVRELEIMEFEYFIKEEEWQKQFEYWREQMQKWFALLGFGPEDIKEVEIGDGDRAHYSKRTVDFHFRYPHKFDEIGGLAYRTDFDLKNHIEHSGVDLSYLDPADNTKFVPHVLEPTFGLGRHLLAVVAKAYTEDELGGERRVFLKFPPHLAPIKAAVFPLLKNKPELVAKAREVYTTLKKHIPQIVWDDNGNIGKRYRRQDEIGTPWCITVDFDTLGEKPELKDTVTLRDRDTGEQRRVSVAELPALLKESIAV
jgi:glycyl-tRNA synthetase